MNCKENSKYGAKGSTETHKFSDTFRLMGRKILKRISTYCTMCNEINMHYLDIQKHVYNGKWVK